MEEKKELLSGKSLKVVNIGLDIFYDALADQGVEAVQVDWRPPAAGDERLTKLLDKLL
jgi:hypothetical protein